MIAAAHRYFPGWKATVFNPCPQYPKNVTSPIGVAFSAGSYRPLRDVIHKVVYPTYAVPYQIADLLSVEQFQITVKFTAGETGVAELNFEIDETVAAGTNLRLFPDLEDEEDRRRVINAPGWESIDDAVEGKIHPDDEEDDPLSLEGICGLLYRKSVEIEFPGEGEEDPFTVTYDKEIDIKLNHPVISAYNPSGEDVPPDGLVTAWIFNALVVARIYRVEFVGEGGLTRTLVSECQLFSDLLGEPHGIRAADEGEPSYDDDWEISLVVLSNF